EHAHEAARRRHRQEQEAQKRRLAGTRRAGEEAEFARRQNEGDLPEDFRPVPIAQAHILKSNQRRMLLAYDLYSGALPRRQSRATLTGSAAMFNSKCLNAAL